MSSETLKEMVVALANIVATPLTLNQYNVEGIISRKVKLGMGLNIKIDTKVQGRIRWTDYYATCQFDIIGNLSALVLVDFLDKRECIWFYDNKGTIINLAEVSPSVKSTEALLPKGFTCYYRLFGSKEWNSPKSKSKKKSKE